MKFLAIVTFAFVALFAQTQTPTLQSYSQARQVLNQGIDAIGGKQALRQIRTVRRDLTGDWLDTGQGRRPWKSTSDQLPPSHEYDEVLTFADYAGNRWFESLKYSPSKANPEHATQIDVIGQHEGFSALRYMEEKPFFQRFAAEDLDSQRTRKFRRFPEHLLLMPVDRPETLQWIGTSQEFGRKQQVISFADATGTRISLYFDEQTHLLMKSEVLRDHPVFGDTNAELLYSDYRSVGKLKLPFRYVDRIAGIPTQDWRATSIQLNAALPETHFQPPPDFARIEEEPPQPKLERLSDHLYLIKAAYNVMFSLFRDFVLIFEAPSGGDHSDQVLRLVRSIAPDKPIRGVVATHFHFDHIAGIRTYVAKEIPIFTTHDAKEVIEGSLSSKHTMHPDLLFGKQGTPNIEIVSSSKVFDDGTYRVELYDFGPTQHVAQILVAYFPVEKTMFEADLWDIPSQDLFVAGSDGVILAQKIHEFGLDVRRIIPLHGIPSTIERLDEALSIRGKYAVE